MLAEFEDVNTPYVKYPNIVLDTSRIDGNAFSVIGSVTAALRKYGVSKQERDEFTNEAMAGDYNHLLRTCMKWVVFD